MNFEILKQQIEEATKKTFIEMFKKYGIEEIYAFALYSDEGAMTVCPSINTVAHLKKIKHIDDIDYYRFEPAEWKYEMIGTNTEFNAICNQLYDQLKTEEINNDNDGWFEEFQKNLFDTCIAVLEKLKNENFFKNIVGKDIFLIFTVSDYEFERGDRENIIQRLNNNAYASAYLQGLETWGD